jgi:hypothetical protein
LRIDPKYFPRFMITVAVISFAAIAWSTISYQNRRLASFEESLPEKLQELSIESMSEVSMEMSMPINELDELIDPFPATLVFWAPWSDESIQTLRNEIANPSTRRLISLPVKDSDENIRVILNELSQSLEEGGMKHVKTFDGTPYYQSWELPGVPTVIYLDNPTQGSFIVGTKREAVSFELDDPLRLE